MTNEDRHGSKRLETRVTLCTYKHLAQIVGHMRVAGDAHPALPVCEDFDLTYTRNKRNSNIFCAELSLACLN